MEDDKIITSIEAKEFMENVAEMRNVLGERLGIGAFNYFMEFARALSEKYKDSYMKTASWHAMCGSTPWGGWDITALDFPGEDSVVKFLQEFELEEI